MPSVNSSLAVDMCRCCKKMSQLPAKTTNHTHSASPDTISCEEFDRSQRMADHSQLNGSPANGGRLLLEK